MTAPRDRGADAPPAPRPVLFRAPSGRRARPFYWSVRRELWENRWLWVAPTAVAATALVGFVAGAVADPRRLPEWLGTRMAREMVVRCARPEAPAMVLAASLLVGAFYALRALHAERGDRSTLFWRSLPVSDTAAVLAKAFVPLVLLPAVALALVVATQLVMVLLGSAMMAVQGMAPGPPWARLPLRPWLVLPYFVAALTLWHAPIYAWLLLVSAWARRAPFLWAALPPLVLGAAERHALGTSYVTAFLLDRWMGFFGRAFALASPASPTVDALPRLTPERLLTAPGLWLGLAFAAACLAAAVHLRRRGDPA